MNEQQEPKFTRQNDGQSASTEVLDTCPWCAGVIFPGEPTGISDGDRMHLKCAAEDEDNAMFERDMGFGG